MFSSLSLHSQRMFSLTVSKKCPLLASSNSNNNNLERKIYLLELKKKNEIVTFSLCRVKNNSLCECKDMDKNIGL